MKIKSSIYSSLFLLFIFCFIGCGASHSIVEKNASFDELDNSILVQNPNPNFPMPKIPSSITTEKDRAIYLSKRYWEDFPFKDNSLIDKPEVTEQGFVDYIHILNYIPFKHANRSIKYLFVKAQENRDMYSHLASLFEKYYYNNDSPFRNEELYIPVLETILRSNILSESEREKYALQQEMIHKNRVGSKASDFVYTLPSGKWKRMHALKANYMILFFAQPNCSDCMKTMEEIEQSEVLKRVCSLNSFSRTMLNVLHIYPKSNLYEWQKTLAGLPVRNWIHAYDNAMTISSKKLYDLNTLPTLYLLDKNKRVILKNTSVEEIESFFLSKE